jgi:hypothetical protein
MHSQSSFLWFPDHAFKDTGFASIMQTSVLCGMISTNDISGEKINMPQYLYSFPARENHALERVDESARYCFLLLIELYY